MKVTKEKGKYYFNDLDIEEVLANRKHILNYVKKEIALVQDLIENCEDTYLINVYKARLKAFEEIRREAQLRK